MNLDQFIQRQGWESYAVVAISEIQKKLKGHEVFFEKWVKKGFIADMKYLENMKADRFNPVNKLSDIKSAIVLTAWYGPSGESSDEPSNGVVARYARGKDYHRQLRKKLIELSNWLKLNVRVSHGVLEPKTYVSVDSGPTVDRVLAECAGLGFFGKNSCLIDPSKGSYFFIASIYSNLDPALLGGISEKKPMPNCGTCTNCMDACPTGAIKAPGQIDGRLCISYLTIENKEGIPIELRSKIGNRLFGCDICQEVCPFNRLRAKRQEIKIEKLKGIYGAGDELDLKEILSIRSDEAYLRKFAGTPLMRAKRRGLIRNACVVAGNSGNKELIPYLQSVIDSEEDEMLKEHASWAVFEIKNKYSER